MNIPSSAYTIQKRLSPGYILAITIVGIALAEVIAMVVIYNFRHLPYAAQVLMDAAIMVIIIFPILYVLSFKPLLLHIQRQEQNDCITQARLRLMQYSNDHELEELLQLILDETETVTGSTIGFFHFLEADQKTIRLHTWSTNTLEKMCSAEGKGEHYDIDKAGAWADAARLRQPVIHNNVAELPNRKGMPPGHALVLREMVIPVIRNDRVMAILGVGNKAQDYTIKDVETVSTLADFTWDIIEHKMAENTLRQSEEKFRAIADWTFDWEMWLDPNGDIIYTSPSCERITGYTPEEFTVDPQLLLNIIYPDDRQLYEQHHQITHDETAGPERIEYRIISRTGNVLWIEHICRPIYSPDNRHLGRRISNREITQRKEAEKLIIEQNQREMELNRTIQTIQADIARDLHDTLGQNIGFLRMNLEHLLNAPLYDPDALKTQLQHMTKAANESYDLIRSMLAMLQVKNITDPHGLFSRYAQQIADRSGIQISMSSQGTPRELSPHQIRQLFYVFREALNNIEKYAGSSEVKGELIWNQDALTLLISDNGCGFNPETEQAHGHFGLKFMHERVENLNGTLFIQSAPDQGTRITVSMPYIAQPRF